MCFPVSNNILILISISRATPWIRLTFDPSEVKITNFPFLDFDVPRGPSYSVYISQLIRFARAKLKISKPSR